MYLISNKPKLPRLFVNGSLLNNVEKETYLGFIMNSCDKEDDTICKEIFMADFTKAFDSLEWDFMYRSLEFFNFGPSFIQWIRTLYNSAVVKIKNNGHLSEGFKMTEA